MVNLAEYPSMLPRPLRDGYGLQTTSPLQTTQMQTGRQRNRRAYTSVPTVVSVTWEFTEEEAQLFEGWFQHGLLDGQMKFLCPLQTPLGIKEYSAIFQDIYKGPELFALNHWRYRADLILTKRPTLTEQETADAIAGGDFHQAVSDVDDAASIYYSRHWLEDFDV